MDLTLEKKHENRIELWADGVSTSFANAIRRYSMAYVPVFAIDTVVFYDNSSSLWDEYLSHRLGQMPVLTPEKTPIGTEVVLSLDETGPKSVYAKDFKSSDKEVGIAQGDLIFVGLAAGQHLHIEAKAKVGTARQHARFQAGIVSYDVKEDKLKLSAEGFYQMPPERMIIEAVDAMLGHLQEIDDVVLKGKKKKEEKSPEEAKKEKAAKAEKKAKKPAEKKPKAAKKAKEPEKEEEKKE